MRNDYILWQYPCTFLYANGCIAGLYPLTDARKSKAQSLGEGYVLGGASVFLNADKADECLSENAVSFTLVRQFVLQASTLFNGYRNYRKEYRNYRKEV